MKLNKEIIDAIVNLFTVKQSTCSLPEFIKINFTKLLKLLHESNGDIRL
jgi:hypothetical protein